MKIFITQIIVLLVFIGTLTSAEPESKAEPKPKDIAPGPKKEVIIVRIEIIEAPKEFTFPGCGCHTKPYKSHKSKVKLSIPKEINGTEISFFHVPPLEGETPWHKVGKVYEFSIERKYIGKAYPEGHKFHTNSIPYASKIIGKLKEIKK